MDAGEGISSDLIARGDPDAMKLGAAHLRRWAASDQRARAKLWQTINAETGRLMSEWNRRVGK